MDILSFMVIIWAILIAAGLGFLGSISAPPDVQKYTIIVMAIFGAVLGIATEAYMAGEKNRKGP